ncbi:copper-translocating P-type ATPase [Sulfurovum sp. zt1-1]|uniref:Copper-translocating P-type ATPase n=1 Tax=Sulfurovum zhangzhouensis TaxID=3019067 RepID=A0ABT7QYK5_9BACT|nr:copper-translocating P-type ATPase [Sulfurovum zhangzhouensis]MDM5271915.1 copper-translocating P-type ATPase [Sulfurovum zhangzhouensis]
MQMHQHTASHDHTHHSHAHTEHDHASGHMHHMHDLKRRFIISLIVTIPILFLSPTIQEWFGFVIVLHYHNLIVFLLSSFIYLYGGKPFLTMMVDEIKSYKPGMMTLISMAITVAYFYSASTLFFIHGKAFFWELATLIDIMLIGHYIEAKSLLSASSALNDLVKLMPQQAVRIMPDGTHQEVATEALQINDLILIRPGEKVPADGIVIEGTSLTDEAFLTGESKPVYKKAGNGVYMGSTNLDGALKVQINKDGKESYLSQMLSLVQEAAKSKSHTQDLANRAAGWLFYLSVSVAAVTFAVWSMLTTTSDSILKAITVLIISCPHALGLAVPLVTAISTSMGAKKGILIRNREAFEKLRDVNIVCFDKTGTLTKGKLSVTEIYATEDEEKMLQYAVSLEQYSEHSLAKAIVSYVQDRQIKPLAVQEFEAYAGIGAKAKAEGKTIMIGGMQLLEKESLDIPEPMQIYEKKEASKVWLAVDNKIIGVFLLEDSIRTQAQQAIKMLNSMDIKSYMLTGDNALVAADVAEQTGITYYKANLLPDEKLKTIDQLKQEGNVVAMVGDGINDAPALLQADIGIAIGAGTDIAIESADIILTKSELLSVTDAIKLSQATYRKMVQNLWWASGYNIIAIPLAAGVLTAWGIMIQPALGAVLMSLSTIIVAFNAQLLKDR